ncbi:MAG: AAA family ATPase, partial [Alphaproteobacteria bacterium]
TLERLSTAQTHPVASASLNEVLKSFGEADGVTSSVSVQVQEAIHHVTLGHQVSCLVGAAGTGKTSVIAKAQRIWEDSGYRVMGLAPTGRAARNLQEVGVFSQTIHRLLGDLASGRQQVASTRKLAEGSYPAVCIWPNGRSCSSLPSGWEIEACRIFSTGCAGGTPLCLV